MAVRVATILPPIVPPTPPTPVASTITPTLETAHLPDFVTSKQLEIKWLEQNQEGLKIEAQPIAKQLVDGFQQWSDYSKLLCVGQAEISAALDIANDRNSTNMAPDKAIVAEGSPERTPGQTEDQGEGYGYGPTILFNPVAPIPKPVADADVRLPVPDDGGLDLEDMDIGTGEDLENCKTPWRGPIRTVAGFMAFAHVSRAESALQIKTEIEAEK